MTTYWSADASSDIHLMIAQAAQNWHKELASLKVKIGVIFALSNDPEKPSVKSSGYPAIASVRLVKGKDSAVKSYDVEMLVDASAWRELSSESKLAVVDHELAHIAVKKKKIKVKKKDRSPAANLDDEESKAAAEEVIYDDRGKPVLRLIKGDWNVGDGFKDVVARHGKNAVEYLNIINAEQLASEAMV